MDKQINDTHTHSLFLYAAKRVRPWLQSVTPILHATRQTSRAHPGVDAVVFRPHGGHHRNAPAEELDHPMVGGRVVNIEVPNCGEVLFFGGFSNYWGEENCVGKKMELFSDFER